MEESQDNRGEIRARAAELETELETGRASLRALQAECAAIKKRIKLLERKLARPKPRNRKRWSRRAKIIAGIFLLPLAALGGFLSGLMASVPFGVAVLVITGNDKSSWPLGFMVLFIAVGVGSALTLAVRTLRRN